MNLLKLKLNLKSMNDIDFIEKYCVIKPYSGKVNKIHLKDYQKKFIMHINKLKKKL